MSCLVFFVLFSSRWLVRRVLLENDKVVKKLWKNFDVHPGPFPENDEISDLIDWKQTEFQALPDVISGASDFAAVFSV
jgi:hypothetical protein